MIEFIDLKKNDPFSTFYTKYNEALLKGQNSVNALSVSSYNTKNKEISSRFVNLKYVIKDKFIFFSNYNSPKAVDFDSHTQAASIMYWHKINFQIRLKGHISKTSKRFNNKYFKKRSIEKNALAICSNQSNKIDSYESIVKKYYAVLEEQDLNKCPIYWGGFSFAPYEIEFWEGNEFRLNKRNLYLKEKNTWKHFILEP